MEEERRGEKIYTLSDPRTNDVRYVGVTWGTLKNRLDNHLSDRQNKEKREWILELKEQGLKPTIELVEYAEALNYHYSVESYWISQFNTWGFDLFNRKSARSKYRNI